MTELLLTLALLHGGDAYTSWKGMHAGAHELNPSAGFDATSVVLSRAALAGIEIPMLYQLSKTHPKGAKVLTSIAIGVSAAGVGHNISVMVRLK